jgi:integrase
VPGRVDLSCLSAADVTGFVQRRAVTIQSRRVQLMTTALKSFLRFARYRGDIDKDLAACVPAVANWKLSTIPRALPPSQVELVLASVEQFRIVEDRWVIADLVGKHGRIRTVAVPFWAKAAVDEWCRVGSIMAGRLFRHINKRAEVRLRQ